MRKLAVFTRSGVNIIKDHNDLINKGQRTHAEIDTYIAEIDEARTDSTNTIYKSLKERIDAIELSGGGGGGNGGGGGTTPTPESPAIDYFYTITEEVPSGLVVLPQSYNLGLGELFSFLNGQAVKIEEVDKNTVRFPIALKPSDHVWIRKVATATVTYTLPEDLTEGVDYVYVVESTNASGTVTLPFNYTLGNKELLVFLNGQYINYTEVSPTTVQIGIPLIAGDEVVVKKVAKVLVKLDRLAKVTESFSLSANEVKLVKLNLATSSAEIKSMLINIFGSSTADYTIDVLESEDPNNIIYSEDVTFTNYIVDRPLFYTDDTNSNKLHLLIKNFSQNNVIMKLNIKYIPYTI